MSDRPLYVNPNFFPIQDEDEQRKVEKNITPPVVPGPTPVMGRREREAIQSLDNFDPLETTPDELSSPFEGIANFGTSALHHLMSSATMGATELSEVTRTKDWRDKTPAEMWGAAIGEAAGFLVPIGLLGKGVRAGFSTLGKYGTKKLAKKVSKNVAEDAAKVIKRDTFLKGAEEMGEEGLEKLIDKSIRAESGANWWQVGLWPFGKTAKKVDGLYRMGLKGEALEHANRGLASRLQTKLGAELGEKGANVATESQINDIVSTYMTGLAKGKHYNSFGQWVTGWPGRMGINISGKMAKTVGKYAEHAADEMLVLSADGIMRDYIRSKAFDDHNFDPEYALKHGMMLGAAFPALRGIVGGGGRENLKTGWNIMMSKVNKADYSKNIKDYGGRVYLRGLLNMWRGSATSTRFRNVPLKVKNLKTGKMETQTIDDVLNNTSLTQSKEGGEVLQSALEQLRSGISGVGAFARWGKDYTWDAGYSLPRMILGSAIMNSEIVKGMWQQGGLPENWQHEALPHAFIGAFMTKGRGAWMSGQPATKYSSDYLKSMELLNINPKGLKQWLNWSKPREQAAIHSRGLLGSETGQQLTDVFSLHEAKAKLEGRKSEKIDAEFADVKEWHDMYIRRGIALDMEGFDPLPLEYYSKAQLRDIQGTIRNIQYGKKNLTDLRPNEWFALEMIEASKGVEQSYLDFLKRLDNLGVIQYSENPNSKLPYVIRPDIGKTSDTQYAEIDNMLLSLRRAGLIELPTTLTKEKIPPKLGEKELGLEIEAFKDNLEVDNIGKGPRPSWEIDNNLFIDGIIASRDATTREILNKIVTGDNEGLSQLQSKFKDSVMDTYFLDSSNKIVNEKNIKVGARELKEVDKDNLEKQNQVNAERVELERDIREIASIFNAGAKEHSTSGQEITIPYENAKAIRDGFDALDLPMPSKSIFENRLMSGAYAQQIKLRRYEKQFPDVDQLSIAMRLEDTGLGWWSQEDGKFYMYDYPTLQKLFGKDAPRDGEMMHRTIREHMGDKVQDSGPRLMKDAVEPNITALESIYGEIPKIRNEMVIDKITKLKGALENVDLDTGKEVVSTLEDAIGLGEYSKAYASLESMRDLLPTYKGEIDAILKTLKKSESTKELSETLFREAAGKDAASWLAVMKEVFEDAQIDRGQSEQMLNNMMAERENSLFYINNIRTKLQSELSRNVRKEASLEELLSDFAEKKGFTELRKVLTKIYVDRPTDIPISERVYQENGENFSRDIRNDAGKPQKSILEILDEYGLRDRTNRNTIDSTVKDWLGQPDGVAKLVEKITADYNTAYAERFIEKDLAKILNHFGNQTKITRATYKDGQLVFEFDVPASKTRDYEIAEGWRMDDKIQIYDISGQALDGGVKHLEVLRNLKDKIRNAEAVPDEIALQKQLAEGDIEGIDFDIIGQNFNSIGGMESKWGILITGYSKPKIFNTSAENLKNINRKFTSELQNVIDNAPGGSRGEIAKNIKEVFEKASDPALQLRFMHWFNTNGKLAYDLFTTNNLKARPEAHFEAARKYIKYSTLFANDLTKPVSKESMKKVLDNSANMEADMKNALKNIYSKFDEIGIVAIADENFSFEYMNEKGDLVETNFFNNRRLHHSQIERDSGILTEQQYKHQIERIKDTNLIPSLNTSAWDGIMIVSKDMYLASLAVRGESLQAGSLKPTIFHNTAVSTLLGKGMYMYVPEISDAMDAKGVQIMMGGSAAKSLRGTTRGGKDMQESGIIDPRGIYTDVKMRQPDGTIALGNLEKSPSNILAYEVTDNNIMNISFADQGVIKTGHGLRTAPLSHTITYGHDIGTVKEIRGWMKLQETIDLAKEWSVEMRRAASVNLSEFIMRQELKGGFENEGMGQTRELIELYNYHHTHPLIKSSLMQMFKDGFLTKLNKPMGSGKQGRYYIFPDYTLRNPYYATATGPNGKKIEVVHQFGEMDLPFEWATGDLGKGKALRPVERIEDMNFSFRENGVDYLINLEMKNNKLEVSFKDHLQEYQDNGYKMPFDHVTPKEVPKAIRELITELNDNMSGDAKKAWLYDYGTGQEFTFGRIAEWFNRKANDRGLDANILAMVERGPRKGLSDYQMVKVRSLLPQEYGANVSINGYDVRVALQGDWDGDAASVFYGMPRSKAESAVREAGIVPDYPPNTLPGEAFKLNPFGIDFAGTGREAGRSKTNGIESYMEQTRRGEMAMGKVLGLNNALSWFVESGMKFNGVENNLKDLGSLSDKLNNSERYSWYANSTQAVVDIAKGINEGLMYNPIETIFFNKDKPNTHLLENHGWIDREMAGIALDIFRKPSRIINDITDRAGKHKARAQEIERMYQDLNDFFFDPNSYMFRELLRRHKHSDDTKKMEIMNRFFPKLTRENMSNTREIFKELKKKGKGGHVPDRVVSFHEKFQGKKGIEALLDLSNAGHLIKETYKNRLFNESDFIQAWDIPNNKQGGEIVSRYSRLVNNASQMIEVSRLLGIEPGKYSDVFVGDGLATKNAIEKREHLSRLETMAASEFERTYNWLTRLKAERFPNESDIRRAEEKLVALSRSRELIRTQAIKDGIRDPENSTNQRLKKVTIDGKKKKGLVKSGYGEYSYFYRLKNDTFLKEANAALKDKDTAEALDKIDYGAIDRTPIIVKAGEKPLQYDRKGNAIRGTFIELQNPISTKQLGHQDVINGYISHMLTKDMPLLEIFPDRVAGSRENLSRNVQEVKKEISSSWKNALHMLKEGPEYKSNIFLRNEIEVADVLRKYFKDNVNALAEQSQLKMLDYRTRDSKDGGPAELTGDNVGVYHLAKALLAPSPVPRTKVGTTQGSIPYYYTNKKLMDAVRNYLYKNHKPVWEVLMKDMGDIYSYIRGEVSEIQPFGPKSSLYYAGKNFQGFEKVEALSNHGKTLFKTGFIDPGMALMLQPRGVHGLSDVKYTADGVGYRDIIDIVRKLPLHEDYTLPKCD